MRLLVAQDGGTWAEEDSSSITQTTPLEPFRKDDNSYWDSNDARFLQKDQKVKKCKIYTDAKGPSILTQLSAGYTYPAVEGVSVDVPSTPEQRQSYIRVLQQHFGLEILTENGRLNFPIFKKTIKENPPPQHVFIPGHRRFSVEAEVVGHAFSESYMLQLLHKGEVVGSFAVLSRGDATRCTACKAHREAGGRVRGVINIPADVIATLIQDGGHHR